MYLSSCLLLKRVKVPQSGNVCGDPPIVELTGRFIQFVILRHWSDDVLSEPDGESLHGLPSSRRLGVDVEDVWGAAGTVSFGESGYCTVVKEFDPFDGSVNAVAVADGETREAFILLVSGGYLFPSLLLKPFEPLVKISDGLSVLLLLLVMNRVPLPDGPNKGLSETAEPDRVVDVEALNEVSC